MLYGQFLGPFDLGLTEWWSQASIYGSGFARDYDHFGIALAGIRFDPHWDAVGAPFGIASLAIGTPGMNTFQGGFTVVRGTTAGLGPAYKVGLFGSDFGAAPDTSGESVLRRGLRDRRLRRQRLRRPRDRSPATRR